MLRYLFRSLGVGLILLVCKDEHGLAPNVIVLDTVPQKVLYHGPVLTTTGVNNKHEPMNLSRNEENHAKEKIKGGGAGQC